MRVLSHTISYTVLEMTVSWFLSSPGDPRSGFSSARHYNAFAIERLNRDAPNEENRMFGGAQRTNDNAKPHYHDAVIFPMPLAKAHGWCTPLTAQALLGRAGST
jgi:hypothetical protein